MNLLVLLMGIGLVYMLLLSIDRRREHIRHNIRGLMVTMAAGVLAFAIAQSQGANQNTATMWGVIAAVVAIAVEPKRSRYVRASEKRKAIARYELTGKKYNPKKHHLDHDLPFARGGSNTADNLRVLDKRENLRKGAKSPWWDLFG